jgi:hypothetical protein
MGKPKLLTVLAVCFAALLVGAIVFVSATIYQRQQMLYEKVDHIFYQMQTEPNSHEQKEKLVLELEEVRRIRATQNTLIVALSVGFSLILLLSFQAIMIVVAKRLAETDRTRVQLAVTQALADSKDFGTGALRVLSSMGELYGFAFGAVWLVDEERGLIRPHTLWASSSLKDQTFIAVTKSLPSKKGLACLEEFGSKATLSGLTMSSLTITILALKQLSKVVCMQHWLSPFLKKTK